MEALAGGRKDLTNEYQFMRSTLEQTDRELRAVLGSRREFLSDADSFAKKREKLETEKRKLEQALLENLSTRTTLEKGKIGIIKQTRKLQDEIHEQEIKLGEVQNEVPYRLLCMRAHRSHFAC
jgi:chromosome segregation ATPase